MSRLPGACTGDSGGAQTYTWATAVISGGRHGTLSALRFADLAELV